MKKRTKSMKSALAFLIALTFIVQSVPAYAYGLLDDSSYDSANDLSGVSGISGTDDNTGDSYYDCDGAWGDITQGTLGDADGGVDVYGDDSYDISYDTSTVSDAAVSDNNLDDTISDDTLSDNGLEYQTITENVYNNCITITGNIPKGAYISAKKIWNSNGMAEQVADAVNVENAKMEIDNDSDTSAVIADTSSKDIGLPVFDDTEKMDITPVDDATDTGNTGITDDITSDDIDIYYSFDIKIVDADDNYYQPVDYGETVTVSISNLNKINSISDDTTLKVAHTDEDDNTEIIPAEFETNGVTFTTDSFSKYTISGFSVVEAMTISSGVMTAPYTGVYVVRLTGGNSGPVLAYTGHNSNRITITTGTTIVFQINLTKGQMLDFQSGGDAGGITSYQKGSSQTPAGGTTYCSLDGKTIADASGSQGIGYCIGNDEQGVWRVSPYYGIPATYYTLTSSYGAILLTASATSWGDWCGTGVTDGSWGGYRYGGAGYEVGFRGVAYNINYSLRGGVLPSTAPYTYYDTYETSLSAPTRTGYTFDGWTGSNGATPEKTVTISEGSTGDKSYTANWTANQYNVTFVTNGGVPAVPDQTITYPGTVSCPNITKSGYALFGWFTDSACTKKFDFNTSIESDTVLYAKWATPCTVTIYPNCNVDPYTVTAAIGSTFPRPDDPLYPGYKVSNWYTDNAKTTIYNFDTVLSKNISLYAGWEKNSYVLTVKAETDFDVGYYTLGYITQEYQSKYTLSAPDAPENYHFVGWKLTSGKGSVSDNVFTFGAGNGVLAAQYDENKCNFIFDSMGGSKVDTQRIKYNYTASEPDAPVRLGYTFTGWYTSNACSSLYEFNTPIIVDTTVYAGWTANTNTKYTVEHQEEQLDGTYKTVSTDYLTGTTDTTVTPNTNNYSGFTSPSEQDMNIDGDGNATIIYKYTRNSYELSVVQGEGIDSVTGSGTYKYGQPVVISAIANAGYRIKNYTGGATSATFRMPARNITVMVNGTLDTAKYTVTYEQEQLDGTYAVTAVSTYSGTVGNTVMAPLNTYDGYTTPTAQALTILDDGTATVIYKYPRRSYTVTITKNEGISSVTGAGTYKYGAPVALTATVASGYTFYEWAGGEDSAEFTMPAEDIDMSATAVVYAGYHNVAFISNTGVGIESQSVINNGTATEPVTPSRSGYDFNGWYINSNCSTAYAFMTPVTADITLYAGWKESASGSSGSGSSSGSVIYTTYHIVSFVSNGGTAVAYQNVADGNTASEPAVPTYAGHIFVGWYTNTACTLEYNFANKVTADTTLYAKWTTGTTSSKTSTTSKSASNSASTGTSGTTSAAYRKTTSTGISLLSHTSVLSTNAAGTTSGNIASGISSNTAEFSNQSMSANRTNMLIETNGLSDNTVSENAGQTTKKSHAGLIIAIILGLLAIMGIIFIILYKKKNDDSDEDDVFDDDEDGDNDDDGSIPESDADIMDEGMTDDDEDTEDK